MSDFPRSDFPAAEFIAGFASRHDNAAHLLARAFAPPEGFAAFDPRTRAAPSGPVSFSPQAAGAPGPKHFSPADPASNPTAGWNPLDAKSHIDPIETAHAAGYAAGLAAARADETRDADLIADLSAALGAGDHVDRARIAEQLRRTVLMLVEKLVGEVGISSDKLAQRIDGAVDLLADAAESAILRVHPDDVALLAGRLPATIFAVGDAGVARGGFVLESASTIVEDGPAHWLEQLTRAVDQVAAPGAAC